MYSVCSNLKHLKNTWRLMNPKYLPIPIFNIEEKSPWFRATAKVLTCAEWTTSNQFKMQANCVPCSFPSPDTQLSLRSKTPKPFLTQTLSSLGLHELFSPTTTESYFKLLAVQSCSHLWGMMPGSTNNRDLTPCGNSPATRNSGLCSLH